MNTTKSLKLRMAAKLVGCIGLIACMIGCAVYCILSLPEVMNIPFDWRYLLIDVAVMFVFVLVSILLTAGAVTAERKALMQAEADAIAEAIAAAEAVEEEACEEEVCEEACEEEACEVVEEVPATKYAAVVAKIRSKIPEDKLVVIDKATAVVKDNAKVIVPVASACVAAMVVTKVSANKRHARNRRRFYEWLG